MSQLLLSSNEWARQQFASADLGDCRRVNRLIKIGAALADTPRGTLPGAMPQWKDLKAAYRLFDNRAVTREKVMQPHFEAVQALCLGPGVFLLIEDSTSCNFTAHKFMRGMGRIGNDMAQGINLHTTLALKVVRWDSSGEEPHLQVLGLAGQHAWVRDKELTRGEGVPPGRERKKRAFSRARESQRWAGSLGGWPAACPDASNQRIYVADREGDVYECLERCASAGFDYVIRACHDRALLPPQGNEGGQTEPATSLFGAAAKGQNLVCYTLKLRARPGKAARQAKIEVRSAPVELRPPYRPGGRPAPRKLFVVEAREVDPPAGVKEPIHWVILTSLDCSDPIQALRVVRIYHARWIIEEYHKVLKTGMGIEESQLEERRRFEPLLGILSLVAARLLGLKLKAVESPDAPLQAGDIEPEALTVLEAKLGAPEGGWTHAKMWIGIARMGGFLARKGDGTPGWQTVWRGWNRLRSMTEGACIVGKTCG